MNYISRSLLGRAVDGGMERSLASNLSFCVTGKCTGLLQPWVDILCLNINGSLWTQFKWRNGGRQTWRRVGKNPVCIVYPAMLEGSLVEKVENTHPCLQSDTSPGTGTGPRPAKVWRILDWGGRGTQGELKNVGLLSKLFGSLCMQFGEHDVYQGSYRPLLPGYRASLSNLLQTWIKCYIEPHTLYSANQVIWLDKTKLDILHFHIKVKADKLRIISGAKYLDI